MKNRLLSIIFASLLAAQLVACGSNTKEETNTNDGSDITQSESEQKEDASSETASENGAQGSYAPADFNPEDVYVATDQESTIDISGCDTFTQIVDKLENGLGYANATIGDADVLLVSSGTYEWEAGVYAAIDSEIFYYKDGVPTYLATVSSSGTADPLKIKDGNLYVAGHHFIFKYLIDSGYLIETEEAYEEYDETGNEIYYYKTCNSQFEDYDAQTAKSRYEELFTELEGAAVISFDTVGGNS